MYTYFLFNRKFYNQKDGTAMGSLLVANYFMKHFDKQALNMAPKRPSCWFRHVDDTFVIWLHGTEELWNFQQHLNSIHTNIKFSTEMEENGMLPFLDI
jgi:hypothetical protein